MTPEPPDPTSLRRLREALAATVPSQLEIIRKDGTYAVSLEGRPFTAEAAMLEAAITGLIVLLRDYAQYMNDHPAQVHHLKGCHDLIQLVALSTDEELVSWLWRRL